uniref:Chromosome partition protein Smc n=1 Tax=Thermogemmatispora argillosa TaxID=2045280 RepID=A0A455SWE5_9CHLR|nr:chromosome partition protein Smc [Thermogemmatispora argillosa]
MYLKRLELLGFKSFATRTCLEFSPGITAVVGPNGAGKSNIADAIRWVLGEQSMRQLRGRKSEDIIFAGGHGKAALGMAEVSLTIDNSTGWMPSEYSEITVTRRSYRSGENEYFINKQKVRLKDVLLLLAQARIGHDSYTVIGQGLIDAALSLRPEERRSLFEDAAGIRPYQVQRAEAEQRLRQTEANLQRLHDIVNEIEPRLGPLEEQARRAREYARLQDELRQALVAWYHLQWHRLEAAAARAEAAETEQAARLRQLEQALQEAERLRSELLRLRQEAQQQISAARRAAGEATGQLQRLERELAVAEERVTGMQRQREEQQRQERQLRERLIATEQRLTDLEEAREQAREALDEAAQALASLEATVAQVQKEYELDERRLRAAQNDLIQTQARLGAAQTELGRQQKHLGERNRTLATRREAVAQAQQALRSLETRLAEQRSQLQVARDEEQQLTQRKQALQRLQQEAQQELERLKGLVAEAERTRRTLADRLAMLRNWQRDLSGYSEGVRALLRAPREQVPGLIAPLPRLLLAPAGLERAIEAALAEALQGVVVSTRAEAERCLSYLEHQRAGRALLLWLHETSPSPGSVASPAALPPQADQERAALERLLEQSPDLRPGVLGLAWQFTECEDQYRPLCYRLLTGVLLVEDLSTASRLQAQASAFSSWAGCPLRALVTRKGEVLSLQQGWLSGGHAQGEQSGGLLHYERELRELPAQLEAQTAHIDRLNGLLSEIQRAQEGRRAEQASLDRELQKNAARLQELNRALAHSEREQERLQTELKMATSVEQQLAAEIAGLEQELQATRERVQAHERAQQELQGLVEELQAQVEERAAVYRRQQEELGRLRTQMAVKRQEAKTLERQVSEVQQQLQELRTQLDQQQLRLRQAEEQQQRLRESIARQQGELEQAREQARQAGLRVQQREQALRELEQRLAASEQELAALRQEQSQCEVLYRRCLLESQRARDALEALQSQLQEDLGLNQPQELRQLLSQLAPPSAEEAERAEHEEDEEAKLRRLRRQIEQTRSRLKALGGCDPDAPRQYEEERQRFEFLSSQIADMEQAAEQLHTIIGQLDATMTRQFETTFEAVNARFREHFRTLFNGGQARLELVTSKGGERSSEGAEGRSAGRHSPSSQAARNGHGAAPEEEPASAEEAASMARSGLPFGVEVIVQPPGKKVQDLSLLSGGERALVSAALLFSLLEINPPPFCLLDEVDAALDESNVSRFCDILKRLAERTQFIVITHNRVTMTAAQAIYGVSMGSDSVSRLASLRLSEAEAVVARQRSG